MSVNNQNGSLISIPNKKTFSTKAISLKSFDYGESDKIIFLFSRDYGIIRAIAKGVKKSNSKFSGYLDLLNSNEVLIRKGSSLNTIIQCDTFKNFPLLRTDYDKLIYSLYIGELILLFINEDERSEESFDFLLYTLESMQYSDNPLLHTIWFEMHLLSMLGYQSNLDYCDNCLKEITNSERIAFSLHSGSVICSRCIDIISDYRFINQDNRALLKRLKTFELSHINDYPAEAQELLKIQSILKEYFSNISERKIKTLSVL